MTENQSRPLPSFQVDFDDKTGDKVLTCCLLPQGVTCITWHGGDSDDIDQDTFMIGSKSAAASKSMSRLINLKFDDGRSYENMSFVSLTEKTAETLDVTETRNYGS